MRTLAQIAAAHVTWLLIATIGVAMPVEKPGWLHRTFGSLTWDEAVAVKKTPREICSSVRHHVDYREDLDDIWAGGMETWDRGFGDCEDLAACVVELCKNAGIEAEIKVFHSIGSWEAHAVVVGRSEGQLWISSNGWFEKVKSLEEAKIRIAKEQGWDRKQVLVSTPEEVKNGTYSVALAGSHAEGLPTEEK